MKKVLLLSLVFMESNMFSSTAPAVATTSVTTQMVGPIIKFVTQHPKLLGSIVGFFALTAIIHYALSRVPLEENSKERYQELKEKILSGQATKEEIIAFIRTFIFPGSKEDVVDIDVTTWDKDGNKVIIHKKQVIQPGSGFNAWMKFRIFDNMEKWMNPLIKLGEFLLILDAAIARGALPGSK